MEEDTDSSLQPLPDDLESLKGIIDELRKKEKQLLRNKQETENEFGKRRAKFKELFLSREEELEQEREKARKAGAEAGKYNNELQMVLSDCEAVRAAAAILESTQKEEMESIRSKYQEELASLQHIMREGVKEARDTAAQQYELERHSLLSANHKLDSQVKELRSKLGQDGKGPSVMSAMSDAMAGVVKRNASGVSPKSQPALEDGMKKAQEDADAWRSIVMPLEQEIHFLKSRLKDAQDRAQTAEAKLKTTPEKESKDRASESKSNHSVEDLQEKVKELSQYLESERSSRTDLEMYVAVLNTQKGVLQEDAEKLRKELHNVCRILEQEKTSHRELKKTWQMANDQFVESQTMQNREFTTMWSLLTTEQKIQLDEQRQNHPSAAEPLVPQLVNILTPIPSPVGSEFSQQPFSQMIETTSQLSDISSIPCENALVPIQDGLSRDSSNDEEEEDDNKERGRKRAHSASDIAELDANIDVARAKSADCLSTGTPVPATSKEVADAAAIRNSPLLDLDLEPRPRTPSKEGRIDWQDFHEEVKVSHESEMNRACIMCVNYERQLQKVQAEKQKFQNLSSNLQIALEQERKALFEEQRLRSRLEQSVANAGEDAQTRFNEHAATVTKLEKLVTSLQQNYTAAKEEAQKQIQRLVASREQLTQELNRMRVEYSTLQDSALQQMTQMDSDSRIMEMREQLLQIRAAGEGTEEKLRSEIAFLKDRAIADQMNKDSMEEMLQADVDSLKADLAKASEELKLERLERHESDGRVQKSEQLLRNIEAKSKQVIIALRGQLDEASDEKAKLEEDMKGLKNQLQSLNIQLNESETVQRDFVKLSQTLQMQMAELQESEKEVRWEHKDDVMVCHKCEKTLNSNKEKYHCHHCGKIFCESCRSMTFSSAVTRRPHQVCNTCYAMLSNDSNALVDARFADGNR